ncbi:sporulation protein [Actinomadura rubteroloni]|nr:sporulation protein [Actinomadura rubteroloni]
MSPELRRSPDAVALAGGLDGFAMPRRRWDIAIMANDASIRIHPDGLRAIPGGTLSGEITVRAGAAPLAITSLSTALQVRCVSRWDDLYGAPVEVLHTEKLAADLRLDARESVAVPYSIPIGLNTPITYVDGTRIRGDHVRLRVFSTPSVSGTPDFEVRLEPAPPHRRLLDACAELGLRPSRTSLGYGAEFGLWFESDTALIWLNATNDGERLTVTVIDLNVMPRRYVPLPEPWITHLPRYLSPKRRPRS